MKLLIGIASILALCLILGWASAHPPFSRRRREDPATIFFAVLWLIIIVVVGALSFEEVRAAGFFLICAAVPAWLIWGVIREKRSKSEND